MKRHLVRLLIISFFLVSFASCGAVDKGKKNYTLCRKRIIEYAKTIDQNSTSYSKTLREKVLDMCKVYGFQGIQDFKTAKDKYESIFKDDPERVIEGKQLSAILEQVTGNSSDFGLRAVSLRVLLQELKQYHEKGEDIPGDISDFCGLTRIMGYVVDEPNRDIILLGEVEPNAPPLYLEDFVIALRNAWLKYAKKKGDTIEYSYPGCSIDPDPQVIQKLNNIENHIPGNSQSGGAGDVIERWKQICESPQEVSVFGVPFHSRFAWVMVKADYDMKTIVDGSDSLELPGFKSLLDIEFEQAKERLLNGNSNADSQSLLNRFEFCPGENKYLEDESTVVIDKCDVILMTEEQYLSKDKKIVGMDFANPNALGFAQRFSALYAEISVKRPVYRELENLYRFVALAKILKFKAPYENVGLDIEYLLGEFPESDKEVCETLPGRSNVKRFENQQEVPGGSNFFRLWIPSCGGVSVNINVDQNNFSRVQEDYLKESGEAAIGARPSINDLSWNYSCLILNRQDLEEIEQINRVNIKDFEIFSVVDQLSGYTLCNNENRIIFNGNNKLDLLGCLAQKSNEKKGVLLTMMGFRSEDDVALFSHSLQLLNDKKDLIFIPVVVSNNASRFLEMLLSPPGTMDLVAESEPELEQISEGRFKNWSRSEIELLLRSGGEEMEAGIKILSKNKDIPIPFLREISEFISSKFSQIVLVKFIKDAFKELLNGNENSIIYIRQLYRDIRIP